MCSIKIKISSYILVGPCDKENTFGPISLFKAMNRAGHYIFKTLNNLCDLNQIVIILYSYSYRSYHAVLKCIIFLIQYYKGRLKYIYSD